MEAAIFVSIWIGTSLPTGSLQVRARAKISNEIVYDVKSSWASERQVVYPARVQYFVPVNEKKIKIWILIKIYSYAFDRFYFLLCSLLCFFIAFLQVSWFRRQQGKSVIFQFFPGK